MYEGYSPCNILWFRVTVHDDIVPRYFLER
jgi:hypothetical protein